MMIDATHGADW